MRATAAPPPPGTFPTFPTARTRCLPAGASFSNRATNALYTIFDGATQIGGTTVNQQVAPSGDQIAGIAWQSLGSYQITNGNLRVRLTDNANGIITADAVRIVLGGVVPQVPEIDVAGFEHSINDGDTTPVFDDATEFGGVPNTTNSVTHEFTIQNHGNAPLNLFGSPIVQVSGLNAQRLHRRPAAGVDCRTRWHDDVQDHVPSHGHRPAAGNHLDRQQRRQ